MPMNQPPLESGRRKEIAEEFSPRPFDETDRDKIENNGGKSRQRV
jgi:hypothetical protein